MTQAHHASMGRFGCAGFAGSNWRPTTSQAPVTPLVVPPPRLQLPFQQAACLGFGQLPRLPVTKSFGSAAVALEGTGTLVPLEYVNERLRGITAEYENLFRIQRELHATDVRRMETEAARLRCLASGGNGAATAIAIEEEIALAIRTKQKKLDVIQAILCKREQQITDMQTMCKCRGVSNAWHARGDGDLAIPTPHLPADPILRDSMMDIRTMVFLLKSRS